MNREVKMKPPIASDESKAFNDHKWANQCAGEEIDLERTGYFREEDTINLPLGQAKMFFPPDWVSNASQHQILKECKPDSSRGEGEYSMSLFWAKERCWNKKRVTVKLVTFHLVTWVEIHLEAEETLLVRSARVKLSKWKVIAGALTPAWNEDVLRSFLN